jgi:uncharacterized SAM-binding protein YcdF (DUF218 family)
MPRAQHLFEQTGATIIPYPVDFYRTTPQPFNPLHLLPSANAFQQTELAWREVIGRAYYGV